MPLMAYVNDLMVPLAEARIPVLDRGFLFGDSLFEVMKISGGVAILAGDHVERLTRAAAKMRFTGLPGRDVFLSRIKAVIQASGLDTGYVYVQLTRGAAPQRSRVSSTSPAVVIFVDDSPGPDQSLVDNGASAVTVPDDRALFGEFKTTSAMPRIMSELTAIDNGCYEAIYRHRDGRVFEATAANLFVVKCGHLLTPVAGRHVLSGVTRDKIMGLAGESGMDVRERHISYDELLEADEVFLTGSVKIVVGIVEVDGQKIGDGRVGDVTRRLRQAYIQRFMNIGNDGKTPKNSDWV